MRTITSIIVAICATCTVRAEESVVHDGTSLERAVRIEASSHEEGLKAEHAWLKQHLPGAYLAEGGVDANGEEFIVFAHRTEVHDERIFSIYVMELPDGSSREVYFDQSSYFGKENKESNKSVQTIRAGSAVPLV